MAPKANISFAQRVLCTTIECMVSIFGNAILIDTPISCTVGALKMIDTPISCTVGALKIRKAFWAPV